MMRLLAILTVLILFSSCVRNKNAAVLQEQTPSQKVIEVVEVLQANAYTYLKVQENFSERWVAVKKADIQKGEVYYYDEALQMNNFKSKDLDRTFDIVYFINEISKEPFADKKVDMGAMHRGVMKTNKSNVQLEKSDSELSIASVFKDKKLYSSKEFEIKAQVVKVTPQVMGKNWIHIQDGSDFEGSFDLTVTTMAEGIQKGDVVVFKGTLSLDKDFGYGYSYAVLMEDAKLLTKTNSEQSL